MGREQERIRPIVSQLFKIIRKINAQPLHSFKKRKKETYRITKPLNENIPTTYTCLEK